MYNTKEDLLEATDDLINGDSEVMKAVAGNVKEWAGNWDAVWDNVLLRAKIKEALIEYAKKSNMYDLLEARFTVEANDQFHKISDSVLEEVGELETKRIFFEWEDWLKKEIKKRKIL